MRTGLIAIVIPILASCGIGSEGVPDNPAQGSTGADGLYSGTTSNGRAATGLVLDDGSFYVLYSVQNRPGIIAGAVQGSGLASNGTFSASNAKDVNLEGNGLMSANVSMNYVTRQSLKGTLTYPSSGQTITVNSTYDSRYERTPSVSMIAGSYSGTAASSSLATENATVTVSNSGAVSGVGSNGCSFTGTISARTRGNAYNTTINFGSVPCMMPGASLRGIAYFDEATKRLYSVVMTSSRNAGFIFAGSKQ